MTADAFSDITAPLLIILAGLVVAGRSMGLERRRTLRARSPSLVDWQHDHGEAIDDWADTVDGIMDGSTPEAERHKRLRKQMNKMLKNFPPNQPK